MNQQISTQLAKIAMQNPLTFSTNHSLNDRITWIKAYLLMHQSILALGELEHSNDWDPCLTITLQDGTLIGDEPGYDIATIQDDKLLLEHPNELEESPNEDEDCYYTIPIDKIQTFSIYYH